MENRPLAFYLLVAALIAVKAALGLSQAGNSATTQPDSGGTTGAGAVNAPATTAPAQVFQTFDLSKAPVTSNTSLLPDIWEEVPPGHHSLEVRKDVIISHVPYQQGSPSVVFYWNTTKNCFYVQCDLLGSSTHHFYGPFQGDPTKAVLLLPTTMSARP